MNKRVLLISACILPLMATAQPNYDLLFRTLTKEEIFAGKYFELYSKKQNPNEGKKPTLITQRMIASAYRTSNGNAVPELQDSTRYIYSGTRGAAPLREPQIIRTLADFDTAFIFSKADNFTIAYPLYGQQFNGSNGLLHRNRYNTATDITEQSWVSYHASNRLQKASTLSGNPSGPDWTYYDTELNDAGQRVRDSSATMTAGVFQHSVATTQYVNGRRETAYAENNLYNPGIEDTTHTYFRYDSPSSQLLKRDSSIHIRVNGSVTTTQTSTREYIYNSADRMVEMIGYSEPNHQPSYRTQFTYNPDGQILSKLSQTYNTADNSWVNNSKNGYGYTQSYNTFLVDSVWDASMNRFKEMARSNISLNTAGLPDTMKNYFMGMFVNLKTYIYDNNKNKTEDREYTISNGNVSRTAIYNYYYEDYEDGKTGIGGFANKSMEVLVYPNPASSTLYCRIETIRQPADLKYLIYDASGKCVLAAPFPSQGDAVDISRLNTGIYFLEIKDSKLRHAYRQSFIKQ